MPILGFQDIKFILNATILLYLFMNEILIFVNILVVTERNKDIYMTICALLVIIVCMKKDNIQ